MAGTWPLHPPREQHETPPPLQLAVGFPIEMGTRLAGFRICPAKAAYTWRSRPYIRLAPPLFPVPLPRPPHQPFPPATTMLPLSFLPALLALAPLARAQVTATYPNGATNPDAPEFSPIGSYVNQSSESRLISLNGPDDFCLWGPRNISAVSTNLIGNIEPEVVAYCSKPRNNARIIPDGVVTAAHVGRLFSLFSRSNANHRRVVCQDLAVRPDLGL